MPITVSLPSRNVELEFPDSMTEQEIQAAIDKEYPRSGQDVAFEVQQDMQNSIEPFGPMSKDDYLLYRKHLAEKKTSFGDALGIATDTFNNIINDVGTGIGAAAYKIYEGEYGKVAKSAGKGIYAGTLGLIDVADKVLNPASRIPSKEEFLNTPSSAVTPKMTAMGMGVSLPAQASLSQQSFPTEQDYNALIEREKARDSDITNRLFEMEAILQSAPIEEVARGSQYLDPTMLAGGASALLKAGAKTLFKKGAVRTGAQTASTVANAVTPPPAGVVQTIESGGTMFAAPTIGVSTAPRAIGQAALGTVERGAGAVKTVTALPGKAIEVVGNVAESVIPGTGMATKGAAMTGAALTGAGVPLAASAATSKIAETVQAAARAARSEASRASPLERAAMRADISPAARKLAAGLAQIQPLTSTLGRVAGQALKEGAQNAVVGAGLGYLAERNLEGAAAGAGGGFAFGGMSGAFRSAFGAGKEALGYSTSRTARQAVGDINTFISERPQMEQAAWSETFNRLVEKVGPEKAAAQADAMKVAEAAGGRVRIATPDEVKQWQNPGWMNVDGTEVVLNPIRILGDTAAHEATHVLFASTINRAFKPEIESAIFGTVDPTNGEIIRPGIFNDVDLAKISDQIADSYGKNTTASNEFRGYANRLRNTTDAAALSEARTRIADELTATYAGKMFGRLRAGRFNPDRLPLVYRRVLNSIEDGIVDKFRTVLMEQGQDLGFYSPDLAFVDSKGRKIRIPELDAIIKKAMQPRKSGIPEAKAKPDLIPVNPADRSVWLRTYGGAQGIVNADGTPKSVAQINAEATARWQDMTSRLAALPDAEKIGLEFSRDSNGKAVMTAKGQLSDAAINTILSSGALDQSSVATLREVLNSLKNFDKATFDTRYYGVYTRGRGGNKMVAGVKSASQNEILPYSVEVNSKDGVLIRAVDVSKVRDRLATALNKPQFKGLYGNAGEALKDFRAYLTNLTNINAVPSEVILGGGVKGSQKRNLFYDALGLRLRNGETLVNAPDSIINKSQNTIKSYRVERFAKLVDSGERLAFEEGTTYERAMKNFQPDAFAIEQLPNGEAMTNPDGYRILKKTGSKLFRVYDDKGELIGVAKNELGAMRMAQRKFIDGWHGSPHNFMRFTTQKIGTGEGNQAYGYGLYIAESPIVAKGYKERLSSTPQPLGNRVYDLTGFKVGEGIIRKLLPLESLNEIEAARASSYDLKQVGSSSELKRIADASRQASKESGEGGSLYRVQLNVLPEQLLDWDKPLSEQPQAVQRFAAKHGIPADYQGNVYRALHESFIKSGKPEPAAIKEQKLSKEMAKAGIPGIRYLDRDSRSTGEGTSNYVIFDDGLIRIVDRNGKSVGKRLFRDVAEEGYNVRFQPDDTIKKSAKEEKRFQPISPEQDTAYLSAVKAGDTEKAQRMVNEAAKAAGFNIGPVFHGTKGKRKGVFPFTVFDTNRRGQNTLATGHEAGSYFAENRRYAEGAAYSQTNMGRSGKPVVGTFFLRNDVQRTPGVESAVEYVATDPSQIKSADPVTYDDAGNVIPLSQRFNPESPDIRFQPDPASPNILVDSKGNRIIKSASGKYRVYNMAGALLGVRESEQSAIKLATK